VQVFLDTFLPSYNLTLDQLLNAPKR